MSSSYYLYEIAAHQLDGKGGCAAPSVVYSSAQKYSAGIWGAWGAAGKAKAHQVIVNLIKTRRSCRAVWRTARISLLLVLTFAQKRPVYISCVFWFSKVVIESGFPGAPGSLLCCVFLFFLQFSCEIPEWLKIYIIIMEYFPWHASQNTDLRTWGSSRKGPPAQSRMSSATKPGCFNHSGI